MKEDLSLSFRHDYNLIGTEFGFYKQLSPRLQTKLVTSLFKTVIEDFSDFFAGCEQQFINGYLVHLRYNVYEHGQVI